MKSRWNVGLLLCLSLAASGCATTPLLQPPAQLVVAKVEFGFESTYNVGATAYLEAVHSGRLTGANKAKAKSILMQAYAALRLARTAQALGDATTVDAQSAAIAGLVVQVLKLAKGDGQ